MIRIILTASLFSAGVALTVVGGLITSTALTLLLVQA